MNAERLLERLRELDIRVSLGEDGLRCSAPKGRLTLELQTEIAESKSELIRVLRQYEESAPDTLHKTVGESSAPLSSSQEALWFLQRLQPENTAYNITAYARLHTRANMGTITAALRAIVRRHEIFRTIFPAVNGVSTQEIQKDFTLPLEVSDLRGHSEEDQTIALGEIVREQSQQPFHLADALPFRLAVAHVSDEDSWIVLTVHHIAYDMWSNDVFFRELRILLDDFASGRPPNLPELPVQYADYARWQRDPARHEASKTHLSYWVKRLEGAPATLELPLDHPRQAAPKFENAVQSFALSIEDSEHVKRLAQQEGATLFMMLLAVFKSLIFRYTGQAEILVGTPVSTRLRPELEPLIGYFVNTLVLRTDVSQDMTSRQLLHAVRETVLEGHAHMDTPFEDLVQQLHPERSLSRSPLFQVSFALQNVAADSEIKLITAGAAFDITLYVRGAANQICGVFEYNTALFDAATIKRLAERYSTLAAEFAQHPDDPIGSLQILTAPEREHLLDIGDGAAVSFPRTQCIHDLFAEQVARNPEALAVMFGSESLTYRELDLRSNRLANRLRSLGVGPDVLVGLCLERSANLPVALLAILKAGGAYVPVDPQYPPDRIAYMLQDSQAAVLITEQHLLDLVPQNLPAVICLDRDREALARENDLQPVPKATPEHLAYVIYTSGSTGKPKGVELTHRSVVNFLASMRTEPGLAPHDRLLAVTTLCFDIAGLEMYLPLTTGACVVIAPRAAVIDGAALARLIQEAHISVMQATPVTWRLLLDSGWTGTPGLKILCGGEAFPRELANRLLPCAAELWNLYGPTETTIWSTLHRVDARPGSVPIGKPIANTQVYILDEYLHLVPSGVAGELLIGGDGLARGYLRRPELTAEKFVPHPFRPGETLYRTGDLARWLPDGNLEYLQRLDHQVKLRGFRIELGEIETALEQQPAVRQAVVLVREDTPNDQRLTAYLVLQDNTPKDPKALREALLTRLPDFMVPSHYVFLDAFPLTPNRKVDRRALQTKAVDKIDSHDMASSSENGREIVAPRTPLELQLLTIWEQVLNVRDIGVTDNFFDLGGHSLLAVKLFGQLEQLFGMLPISIIFQAPTIETMAAQLSREGHVNPWRSLVAIQSGGTRPPLFLVPGMGGNVVGYADLARHFDADQPVYALQSLGFDGKQEPLLRIEDIAAHFIREVRTVQPSGPYHLGGACVGGVVAYEMAHQLQAAGEEVALLTMIETWPPDAVAPLAPSENGGVLTLSYVFLRILQFLHNLLEGDAKERKSYIRQKTELIKRRREPKKIVKPSQADKLRDKVYLANYRAMKKYVLRPYDGHILLFLAGGRKLYNQKDARLIWSELAKGDCTIRRIDGVDSSGGILLEPYVGTLAEALKPHLEKAVSS